MHLFIRIFQRPQFRFSCHSIQNSGQYSTQNVLCVLGGTPTRGLYLRRTIQHTKCPLCIGWDSNARSLFTEDNTAHKMPLCIGWDSNARSLVTEDNTTHKKSLVYWVGLQSEVSTYERQYSTKNAPCVLRGTPTRGLYLRGTIKHTKCPLCIGWDSNARSLLMEDNTSHKMPLVYWVELQREVSPYGGQYSTQNALVYWVGLQSEVSTCRRKHNTKDTRHPQVMKVSVCYINNKK
jgi:hypothetical protein